MALGLSKLIVTCPDLWEMDTGDFVAIGKDVTGIVGDDLPPDNVISEGERAILIPRKILVSAKSNIPNK